MSKLNKLGRAIVAVMGGCSVVFDFLTPIIIAFYIIQNGFFNETYINIIILAAIFASFYRGLKHILRVNNE